MSYEHQRAFAQRGGADRMGASSSPLSVDDLLVLATIGPLKPSAQCGRRARLAVRVSLCVGSYADGCGPRPCRWHRQLQPGCPGPVTPHRPRPEWPRAGAQAPRLTGGERLCSPASAKPSNLVHGGTPPRWRDGPPSWYLCGVQRRNTPALAGRTLADLGLRRGFAIALLCCWAVVRSWQHATTLSGRG
ncbi:hypothetical protein OG896_02510 [Streptomyces sp. NBC_00669]